MLHPPKSAAGFWQDFTTDPPPGPPYTDRYPARMPDGRLLDLPLRDLGETAVAGLIVNQASFAVVDALAAWMAEAARRFQPDIVAALPTLGHVVGAAVARALGHPNWAALGTTRKLWYDEALSVPLSSITAPGAGRRLWLDPRLLPRLSGRRVLLVDDVISTGSSARAGLAVLGTAGVQPVAMCVAMIQGNRWQADWPGTIPVAAAFATPLFERTEGGWTPRSPA
ncbi:MAG: phosphoribosyltransferase [Proteobacteria bacterium]|nr:phosphoribosyltransferase [Pseudomonadota bacterium]